MPKIVNFHWFLIKIFENFFCVRAPGTPYKCILQNFFPNFREKVEKFFRKFCFFKIMKNRPKSVIFHWFFTKNFRKFLRRPGGSAPRNPTPGDPLQAFSLVQKIPPTPRPCQRMVLIWKKFDSGLGSWSEKNRFWLGVLSWKNFDSGLGSWSEKNRFWLGSWSEKISILAGDPGRYPPPPTWDRVNVWPSSPDSGEAFKQFHRKNRLKM